MNQVQLEFLSILEAVIHEDTYSLSKEIDVNQLMEEAKEHDVRGLIYRILKNQQSMESYKRDIIFQSLTQSRYFQQTLDVIDQLQQKGIKVVLLKGAVLKDLYPSPDLRTMGDVDLLVPEEQLPLVQTYLTELGYIKMKSHSEKHDVYEGDGFQIEVHWALLNASRQKGGALFEQELWTKLKPVHLLGKEFLTLSDEDFLIHLVVHAAGHFQLSGFGVRQLCDLTLWIEKKEDWDWDSTKCRLQELECYSFFVYCLEACRRYLGLNISGLITVDEICFSTFMNQILESGVHGKRDERKQFGHYFAYGKHKKNTFIIWIQCLFPSVSDLPLRYSYAKKHSYLLPIAWIHRFFRVIFHPMYNANQKVYFFFHSAKIAKQKHELLQGLGLSE